MQCCECIKLLINKMNVVIRNYFISKIYKFKKDSEEEFSLINTNNNNNNNNKNKNKKLLFDDYIEIKIQQ